MRTCPDELTDDIVLRALAAGWGLQGTIEYLPVGFGSHHWRLDADRERWFVTIDDLIAKRRSRDEALREPRQRLQAALRTAQHLRDVGLAFVVAPVDTASGDVVQLIGDRFAVAMYRHVEGTAGDWERPTDALRRAALDFVVAVHRAPSAATRDAYVDDFAISSRTELAETCRELDRPWDTGPFAEPTRALLSTHVDAIDRAFTRYDALVRLARERPERMVLTHGEPHPGNLIATDDGFMLIDWDTALIAPPERDLWIVADGAPEMLDAYERATGVQPSDDMLDLYRLWWDLTEVAGYVELFRERHRDTEDTQQSWENLNRYLDPWHSTIPD